LTKDNEIWNPPIILAFENDADAVRQAEQLVEDNDVELWDGSRLVSRISSRAGWSPQRR
jgi:hypothetical protein